MNTTASRHSRSRPWLPPLGLLGAGVLYSVVATRFAPYTAPMRIATALPFIPIAVVAVRYGWHRPHLRNLDSGTRLPVAPMLLWAVFVVVAVVFQLAVYFSAPRNTYPTLSSLASIAFAWAGVRPLAFAAWLWLGWYLVAR